MNITLKLFSSLMEYLPGGAIGNSVEIKLTQPVSTAALIERYKIPLKAVQVVMVNGEFQSPDSRSDLLADGDKVSIWPAIQGG